MQDLVEYLLGLEIGRDFFSFLLLALRCITESTTSIGLLEI